MEIEKEDVSELKDYSISATQTNHSIVEQDRNAAEIIEETPSTLHWRRQDLVIKIPSSTDDETREDFVRIDMPPTPSPTPKRVNFSPLPSPSFSRINGSPRPSSSRTKSNIRSLLPKLSFKKRSGTSEIQNAAILALGGSPAATREKTSIPRTLSFRKLFTPRVRHVSSLPVTPTAHSSPESMHGGANDPVNYDKERAQLSIPRSHSVPVIIKDGSICLCGAFRVVPTTPRFAEGATMTANKKFPKSDADRSHDDGEDIPEEEAVCRICLTEVGEGSDTLKMECSCKGELALAHQECAVKWFSIKGNRTCDVCNQDVQNLPVTLLRIQNAQTLNFRGSRVQQADVTQYRVWQDVPVLVIVSMLSYFCFLEQLLVGNMGSGAIAISLPFSCILGLLASMTSTTMVRRKYVWVYATIQFGLVVLSAHLLYSLVHVQAVVSILLATFSGFGFTMCGNTVTLEVLRWRRRWLARSNLPQNSEEMAGQEQTSVIPHQTQTGTHHHEDYRRNSEPNQV